MRLKQHVRFLRYLAILGPMLASLPSAGAVFLGVGSLFGDDSQSIVYGISGDGRVVVGSSGRASGTNGCAYEAFRWTSGEGIQTLGHLFEPSNSTDAFDASYDGSIIVGYYSMTGTGSQAFRWTEAGGMTELDDLPGGGYDSSASAVCSNGTMIAGRGHATGVGWEAACWSNFSIFGLGDLPGGIFDSGSHAISGAGDVIAGDSVVGTNSNGSAKREGFVWNATKGMLSTGVLPGYEGSSARGISPNGSTVVGFCSSYAGGGGRQQACRWTAEGGIAALSSTNGAGMGSANDASYDGSLILGTGTNTFESGAFLWSPTTGTRSIREILVDDYGLDMTGWQLMVGMAMSYDGKVVVGYGINPKGNLEGWVAYLVSHSDNDGDMMPDDWEYLYFGSTNASTGSGDWDGDGPSDYEEYLADTCPTVASSTLTVCRFGLSDRVSVGILSSTNRRYTLHSCSNLYPKAQWEPVSGAEVVPGTGGLMIFQDTNASTHLFYRVQAVVPEP